MSLEETTGGQAEGASQSDQGTGMPLEETPQNDAGNALASTMAALSGLPGGSMLEEGLQVLNEDKNKPKDQVEPATEKKADSEDPKSVVADIIKEDSKKEKEETPNEEEPKNVEEGNEEDDDLTIDSPIFGGKKSVGKPKETEDKVEFDGADVANEYIKKKTGHENLETLVDSSLKLQNEVESLKDYQTKVSQYDAVFENMPSELYEAIDAHLKGQDWKTPIVSRPNLDFTKTVETQPEETLVEAYLPSQFTREDWEEYRSDDADPQLKRAMDLAINSSKEKFLNERKEIENLQTTRLNEATEKQRAFEGSVSRSIAHLEKSIEGLDSGYVEGLKKNLNLNKLRDIFLEKDGSFKEDAALKMVMAENGYSMMDQYKTIATRKTETKERQAALERTPDKPKAKTKGADAAGTVSPEVQARLDQISGGFKKNTVY